MSDNLTPYEQTYGAAQGGQPAAPAPESAPAPEPAQPPAPEPQARVQAGAPCAPASAPQPPAPQDAAVPGAPAAPPPPPAPNRKVWPWVVLVCAVSFLLLVGGCASCAVLTTIAALDDYPDQSIYDERGYHHGYSYDDGYGYGYHHDEPYGGYGGDYGYTYDDGGELLFTYDEVSDLLELAPGTMRNGKGSEGLYVVGGTGAGHIEPGLYYLEGDQDAIGEYLVFSPMVTSGDDEVYRVADSIIYLGNYYADFEEGELVAFMPAKASEHLQPATDEPLGAKAPYQSGCYRVGVDIPAGTYAITLDAEAAEALLDADAEPSAIVMNDLDFDFSAGSSSIAEEVQVIAGGKKTITVKAGQYLELIGTQAAPQG